MQEKLEKIFSFFFFDQIFKIFFLNFATRKLTSFFSGTEFPFPQPNVNRGMKSPKSRENGGEENPAGGALTNRERSISEPNVNSIIVDRPLPPELSHFRNDRKDIRSKFEF